MILRDCSNLYVSHETYHCATIQKCIACAYKIGCFDVVQDVGFCSMVPNVRPELCPRTIQHSNPVLFHRETMNHGESKEMDKTDKNKKRKKKMIMMNKSKNKKEKETHERIKRMTKKTEIQSTRPKRGENDPREEVFESDQDDMSYFSPNETNGPMVQSHLTNKKTSWMGYTLGMNILTIGDGDFTFSLALQNKLLQLYHDSINIHKMNSTTAMTHTLLPPYSCLVATSYESIETLVQIYPKVLETMDQLKSAQYTPLHSDITSATFTTKREMKHDTIPTNIHICMQVDATRLQETLFSPKHQFFYSTNRFLSSSSTGSSFHVLKESVEPISPLSSIAITSSSKLSLSSSSSQLPIHYDRIVWNFPCLAMAQGQDGQNEQMEQNKKLLRDFITNVVTTFSFHVLSQENRHHHHDDSYGEIHITHKTKPPYDQWNLVQQVLLLQKENMEIQNLPLCLEYKGRIVFDKSLFPLYVPRKALDRKSFPCHDACIYIFSLQWNPKYTTAMMSPTKSHPHDTNGASTTPMITAMSQEPVDKDPSNVILTKDEPLNIDSFTTTPTLPRGLTSDESHANQDLLPVTETMISSIRYIHLLYADQRKYESAEQHRGHGGRHGKKSKRQKR